MSAKEIIIHCSDSPDGRNDTVLDIDKWHQERGFKRLRTRRNDFNPKLSAVGYQYVICRDGEVQTGRAENEVGAHCLGHNTASIGICMIGRKRYSPAQWASLIKLLQDLQARHPDAKICGHFQFATNKPFCPGFDVPAFVAAGYAAPAENRYA